MMLSQLAAVFLQLTLLGPGTEYNSLKIAFGGISQPESASYLVQRPKLPLWTKFHAGIRFCTTFWPTALTIKLMWNSGKNCETARSSLSFSSVGKHRDLRADRDKEHVRVH